ncbi:hypothetical protein COX86_03655 [Candidatus Micrarchaeota archaeon CG_4_10_14_0_2_um_filter_60_11]
MLERFYQQLSSIFPRTLVHRIERLMLQGGFEELQPRLFMGFALFFSVALALLAFFLVPFITENSAAHALAFPLTFTVVLGLFYIFLLLAADSRAKKIEEVLPDMLEIISANMRAGMTLENAIWSAARPEFGPLRDEIKRVSADTFSGSPIQNTLTQMTKRVRSVVLERAVRLIVEGIKLGGEMSHLLEEVADDIRSNYRLREQIATSTLMYAMFIVFASTIAAPLLFGVSVYYSEMNEKVMQRSAADSGGGNADVAAQQGMGTFPGMGGGARVANGITSSDFWWFAVACLAATNFLGALILSTIRSGHALRGIQYAPLMALVAILIFIAANAGIKAAFSGIMA